MKTRSRRSITLLTDVRLITCIVQSGLGDTIVQAAQDAGAQGATVFYAKGSGVRERLGILGVAVEVEKEVVNIVVSSEQLETVFNNIYLAGHLDTPGMGFMYVTPLEKAATYIPEELLEEVEKKHSEDAS
ncbi:MAG: P-II family nitrogen regulator [Gammaproteobacteria bacterium]|nr:MAG: P-II family nitrogen regulator [Gammaproteobacteria bacterium]